MMYKTSWPTRISEISLGDVEDNPVSADARRKVRVAMTQLQRVANRRSHTDMTKVSVIGHPGLLLPQVIQV